MTDGPKYDVPLGRKNGLNFATEQATIDNLVAPFANTTTILDRLAAKGLDATDAVALSGAHTIGISHCTSFTERLYPNQDRTMDKTFANNLKRSCPTADSNNTVNMDIRSPNVFDNKYYVDLMNRQGLFTSDQDLYTDRRTRGIVTSFAVNQSLFFEKFVIGMIKMGQLNVLTGGQGEIRNRCDRRNKDKKVDIATVVEELEETFSALF
ncbi:Peroxidase 12 [Capsicum annuum]|nr:Peroxidase 12 [Capsicum annuum]